MLASLPPSLGASSCHPVQCLPAPCCQGAPIPAKLSSHHGEEQRVGRDSPLARRGFEPAPSIASAGIQSICKERRFFSFSSCSEEMGTEGQRPHDGGAIYVLVCSALPLDTSLLQCSGTCNLQLVPECLDLLSSRNVQCSLVEIMFSAHHGRSPVPKPSWTLPFAQVPVRAVAGVAGGGEGAGSPVQAGLGLAGTVPKLTALTRKQPGADAGVTWRG